MKKIILFFTLAFFGFAIVTNINAQETSDKLTKEEKKKLKQEAEMADWNGAKALAESNRFVFTANQLFTNDGSASLDPTINFLSVIDNEAIIQFGFEGVFIGGNGVGGLTSVGTTNKYEVVADNPKKPVQIYINYKPNAAQGRGIGNFFITIYNDGYAELSFSSSGYRMKGQINTPEKANYFIGNSN